MTIEQIKQECRKAIELAEKATEGPWSSGKLFKAWAVDTEMASDPHNICYEVHWEQDANHIAHARTFAPAAARAVLTCIEALEKECAKFRFPDEDRPILQDALHSICAQFEQP